MTLEELCLSIVDCAHKTAPVDSTGNYFAVGTPAMRGNTISYAEARRIDRATFDSWTTRLRPQEGDLLLAREAPVGPVVRIPQAENVAPGQRTVLLRPNPDVAHPRFLYYHLIAPAQQSELQVKAAGSTVPHLNVADVRTFLITDLPPVAEQRAIAEALGALDDKIAANDHIASVTKRLLFAKFTNLDMDEPGNATLDELIQLNPHPSVSTSSESVYLDMKNLPDEAMTATSWTHRTPRGGARFQNGDTLLARITPCLENGKTGYVDFLEEGEVGVGSTEFIVMRAHAGIPQALPYFLTLSPRFREFAIRHMVGSSGRQRLAASDLAGFSVRRPADHDLAEFEQLSDSLMHRVKAAVDESRSLKATRDELLPLLMSGKIRVRDAEKAVEEVV